ncbi:tRNA pseudouridine38-40 synthase [Friedmanniella luteola]|uniref:tRNA pseudouridine synthase A n=1 Tax=Friedmanniella luteola TaxID=546871 RepID=A0A1H1YWT1_9ACTN|nr:tRNA pseudouridine(38-40) synthase TruA [Friedmanniella luteola]SDT25901.1 tRNA pseudouridine38-40 synthase [Friedmanniella luteola]
MSAPTRRWRLDLAYDGTGFSGWARQPDLRTVQGELETWVTQVLRLPAPASLVCAGRTDTGVHARGQVAHVDLPADALEDGALLVRRLHRVLPGDVVVRSVRPAPAGFDARFGAVWRRYVYRLSDGGAPLDPLHRGWVVAAPAPLDLAVLAAAAPVLLGLRDFGAFCRRREGATSIRTLLELSATRVPDGPLAGVLELTVRADAFCHSMVRSLVGALVDVGSGRRDLDWLRRVTTAAARSPDVQVMPAKGLTLEEVGYPPDEQLVARGQEARSVRRPEPAREART